MNVHTCNYTHRNSGQSTDRFYVEIKGDGGGNDVETFDIELRILIKEARINVSQHKVNVAMGQTDSSTSRSIELRNTVLVTSGLILARCSR